MSSNGPRGNNPSGRYGDRHEYSDYGKVRKKNFYSSSSRRDFRAQLSGANKIALTGPGVRENNNNVSGNNSGNISNSNNNSSTNLSNGIASNISTNQSIHSHNPTRNVSAGNIPSAQGASGNILGQYQQSGKGPSYSSYGNAGSSSYYPSYGGYSKKLNEAGEYSSSFYGGTRGPSNSNNEPWGNRGKQSASTSRGSALSSTDYRKERYEYSDTLPNGASRDNKWKSSYGNRSSLSGSLGGRSYNKWGAYSTFGSKGAGSSALVNSTGGGKRINQDSYNPPAGNRGSYTNLNSKFSVDRYSSARSKDYVKKKSPKESSKDYHIDEKNQVDSRDGKDDTEIEDFQNNNNDNEIDNEVDNEADNDLVNENENDVDAEAEEEANLSKLSQDEDCVKRYEKDEDLDDLEGIEGDIMDEDEEDVDMDDDEDLEGDVSVADTTVDHLEQNDTEESKKKELIVMETVRENDDELYYPEGCIYPLGKLETSFVELEKEFEDNKEVLKYSLVEPVESLAKYPFYTKNLLQYISRDRDLATAMKAKLLVIRKKRLSLWKDYENTFHEYTVMSENMDQQLRVIHPSDDEMRREIDSSDSRKLPEYDDPYYAKPPPTSSRRSRRHGDLVTTEAEFEEVLKSLERQSDEDPLQKAQKVAAEIPDMILDPVERDNLVYMDSNNAVQDVLAWADRITYDFDTNFLEKEHQLFTEGFCHHPKRYGAISRYMGGLRTPEDCVHYYYKTKKNVNYKQILIQHKKKANKRSVKRGKGRSRNSSQVQAPLNAPVTDEVSPNASEAVNPAREVAADPSESLVVAASGEAHSELSEMVPIGDNLNTESGITDVKESQELRTKSDVDELDKSLNRKRKRKEDEKESKKVVKKEIKKDSERPETNDDPSGSVATEDGKDAAVNGSKRSISSYWSINEVTQFPTLLETYGTKWVTIADILGTKTATMVKNYYQRKADKNGWLDVAQAADSRISAQVASINNNSQYPLDQNSTELYSKYPVPPPVPEGVAQLPPPMATQVSSQLPAQLPPPIAVQNPIPIAQQLPTPLSTQPPIITSSYPPSFQSAPFTPGPTYPSIASITGVSVPAPVSSSDVPVAYPVAPVTPQAHTRSTIMSLLNGPSPVKPEPVPSQNTSHKSNVRSLLN